MYFRTHVRQQVRVRSRDPAMKYVADDDDAQALEALLVMCDGQRVEQSLRRMLMQSIAGIDNGHGTVAR